VPKGGTLSGCQDARVGRAPRASTRTTTTRVLQRASMVVAEQGEGGRRTAAGGERRAEVGGGTWRAAVATRVVVGKVATRRWRDKSKFGTVGRGVGGCWCCGPFCALMDGTLRGVADCGLRARACLKAALEQICLPPVKLVVDELIRRVDDGVPRRLARLVERRSPLRSMCTGAATESCNRRGGA
jgi:hypothetical protein